MTEHIALPDVTQTILAKIAYSLQFVPGVCHSGDEVLQEKLLSRFYEVHPGEIGCSCIAYKM